MPKTNGLYEQAKAIRNKADELLKLQLATNAFSTLDSLEREIKLLNQDLKRMEVSILAHKYDIEKLDKKHPRYKEKLLSIQEWLVSSMISRDNYLRQKDIKEARIETEKTFIKKRIKEIEANEALPSSMAKSELVKELLNKMSYGV